MTAPSPPAWRFRSILSDPYTLSEPSGVAPATVPVAEPPCLFQLVSVEAASAEFGSPVFGRIDQPRPDPVERVGGAGLRVPADAMRVEVGDASEVEAAGRALVGDPASHEPVPTR